ncbi:uncharacterized protein DSM5745_11079 [Aspergillus mulundensis]|uniref:DUF1279 domain-containing protein n=1 Tax=Aspergillus mulundensis TaxID=1810919 RepID=A0A3D8QD78_9EURO|nr:hypothetical protein DSM5745_11079 [Aspergillus mulundensis]RDW59384.1 hypothetical protein DSM5745_11079 [Aspergillus mulundensis]
MSFQNTLRRWALRPFDSNIPSLLSTSTTMRFPIRRPFSLAHAQTQVLKSQKQTPSLRLFQRSQWQLRKTLFRTRIRRSFHTTRPGFNKSSGSGYTYQSPNATPSLSQRLKTLSREYGWSALWIYLFLSALDFPFCFAAVKLLGADKIGHYEHVIVESFKGAVNRVWPGAFDESKDESKDAEAEAAEKNKKRRGPVEEASLWTQLALAYAIHKSFIFVRVPLTAAITPKVVKQLRKWGWDVVKGKPKAR